MQGNHGVANDTQCVSVRDRILQSSFRGVMLLELPVSAIGCFLTLEVCK